jgi:hypothetical protein
MRRRRKLAFALLLTASSAGLVALAGRAGAASSGAPSAHDAGHDGGSRPIAPDPPALVARKQWVYVLRWDHGDIFLVDVQETDLGEPRPTPRVMGRFALELYEGKTLVERVRFDFPMLGGTPEDAGTGFFARPRFEPKLKTKIGVLFPVTTRGTRLELWDRATGERWELPWPPVPGPAGGLSPTSDGGAPDAAR